MKISRKIAVWLPAVCLTALLTACGGGGQDTAQTAKADSQAAAEAVTEAAAQDDTSAESKTQEVTEEPETTEAPEEAKAPDETKETDGTDASAEAQEPAEEEMLPAAINEAEEYTMEDLAGEYTAFAFNYMGYTYSIEGTGSTSILTLSADGTGSIEFDGEKTAFPEWTLEDGVVTVTDESGYSATGNVIHGIITLDFLRDGSSSALYAKEGTDTSWLEILTIEEVQELIEKGPGSRTFDVYSAMDDSAGIHLSYDLHTDYMDATSHFEVNAKDGIYASSRTTEVSGQESTTITFYQDGKVYNLFPADMTGQFVTETTLLKDNLAGMDTLHQTLSSFYRSNQYTEETREYKGASYTAEVYPEGTYNGETAFCYDENDKLAFVDVKAYTTEAGTEVPAMFITIHAMDSDVDESALDMSAYTIGS